MEYAFAPLEGITDATFRALHHKYFGGVDRYYMPFISPTIHRCLTNRESRELPEADSVSFQAIPQLLGKNLDDMLWAVDICKDLGYGEVNINLGCPSGTVVSKGKGSGMLANPDELQRFLDGLYGGASLPISLKTRIGIADPSEFPRLLEIYNQYPVKELIIHPRVRKAFYQGQCDMEVFRYAVEHSRNPLCYNGNLNHRSDIDAFAASFPSVTSVMIGRGLVADPGLLCGGTHKERLRPFVDELCETYAVVFGSKRNAIFRMKENWHFLITLFENSDKHWKALRKTTDYDAFHAITQEIFSTLPLRSEAQVNW